MIKKQIEKPSDKRLYTIKYKWLLEEKKLEEIDPMEFYRELFPIGSFEEKGHYSGKPNGILVTIDHIKGTHRVVTDDLEVLQDNFGKENAIMSPISYFGRRRTTKNSSLLYALVFDLDGQGMKEITNTLHQMTTEDPHGDGKTFIPKATYIVLSGHGLHLYYVLKEPIHMKPYIRREVNKIKTGLTKRIWNDYNTTLWDNVQFQPITQGFRIVGSASKMGSKYPVRAFRFGESWTIQELNDYIPNVKSMLPYKGNIDIVDVTPINEAKKIWPEWYQKRIVEGKKKDRWYVKRSLYDWWLSEISTKIKEGHRYFGIMTLAIYAKKCDISFAELKKDAYGLLKIFDSLSTTKENPFTEKDIKAGLQAYQEPSVNYPRDTISQLSGIEIKENKRNYLSQKEHLEIARGIRDIRMRQKGKIDWREGNGRKSQKMIVQQWKKENPEGRKIDCIRETGLSKPTVYKWWDKRFF